MDELFFELSCSSVYRKLQEAGKCSKTFYTIPFSVLNERKRTIDSIYPVHMQACPHKELKKGLHAKAIFTFFAAKKFNSHTVSQSTPC